METPNDVFDKEAVYQIIGNAPQLSSLSQQAAPFANFSENTHELWQYVESDKVEEYLKSRLFFKTSNISSDSRTNVGEIHTGHAEEGIKVPLGLVVNASGFDDWRGRPQGNKKDWKIRCGEKQIGGSMSSLNVMMMYAGTPTEIPPVDVMCMYIQPNGKVFFDNAGGDSHRIAAAILRGNEYIETKNLYIYQLNRDYL